MKPSQGEGGYMFPWSLNPFWFPPLSPINKTTCSLIYLKPEFPWSQNLLRCSIGTQKCLLFFPIFLCFFYLLFIVEEIIIESRLAFPSSQQSNQEFLCSLKIIWQFRLFPKSKFSYFLVPSNPWGSVSFIQTPNHRGNEVLFCLDTILHNLLNSNIC